MKIDAQQLFNKLQRLDPSTQKKVYFSETGWDIDGLQTDIEMIRERGESLFRRLYALDPKNVSKDDYYSRDTEWDFDALTEDIKISEQNVRSKGQMNGTDSQSADQFDPIDPGPQQIERRLTHASFLDGLKLFEQLCDIKQLDRSDFLLPEGGWNMAKLQTFERRMKRARNPSRSAKVVYDLTDSDSRGTRSREPRHRSRSTSRKSAPRDRRGDVAPRDRRNDVARHHVTDGVTWHHVREEMIWHHVTEGAGKNHATDGVSWHHVTEIS
eukprot:391566_1